MREASSNGFGRYVEGILVALDVPRKAVSARTRIHETTLSKKINGVEDFKDEEIFAIGQAVGEYVVRQNPARSETTKRA